MNTRRPLLLAGAVALAALPGSPALAHHSFAMFDITKTVALNGTIKELRWTNPHCWVEIVVRDPKTGKDVQWSIEGTSPNGLTRQGWSKNITKPGDKAVVEIHPLKDGSSGGALMSIAVNGRKYETRPGA
jgi:hypothetical protein